MARAELKVEIRFEFYTLDDVHNLALFLDRAIMSKESWRDIAIAGKQAEARRREVDKAVDLVAIIAYKARKDAELARENHQDIKDKVLETAQARLRKRNVELNEKAEGLKGDLHRLRENNDTLLASKAEVAHLRHDKDDMVQALQPWWDSENTGESHEDGAFIDALPDWVVRDLTEDAE